MRQWQRDSHTVTGKKPQALPVALRVLQHTGHPAADDLRAVGAARAQVQHRCGVQLEVPGPGRGREHGQGLRDAAGTLAEAGFLALGRKCSSGRNGQGNGVRLPDGHDGDDQIAAFQAFEHHDVTAAHASPLQTVSELVEGRSGAVHAFAVHPGSVCQDAFR